MSAVGAAGSPVSRIQCGDEEGVSAQCGQQLNQEECITINRTDFYKTTVYKLYGSSMSN